MWVRELVNGAQMVVCGKACLEELSTEVWTDNFEEIDEHQPQMLACAHCYECGVLVLVPTDTCLHHGDACPPVAWIMTARAQTFAAAYARTTGVWVSSTLWELIIKEHEAEPWLTGDELARRAIAL